MKSAICLFLTVIIVTSCDNGNSNTRHRHENDMTIPKGIALPNASDSLMSNDKPLFGDYSEVLKKRIGPGNVIVCKQAEVWLNGKTSSLDHLKDELAKAQESNGLYSPVLLYLDTSTSNATICRLLDMLVDLSVLNVRIGVTSSNDKIGFVYLESVPNQKNQNEAFEKDMQKVIPLIRIDGKSLYWNGQIARMDEIEKKLKSLTGSPNKFVQTIGDAEQPKSLFLQISDSTNIQTVVDFVSACNKAMVCCYYIQSFAKTDVKK